MNIKGKDLVGAGVVGAIDYYIFRKQLRFSRMNSLLTSVGATGLTVVVMNNVRKRDPEFQEMLLTPQAAHVGTAAGMLAGFSLFWNGPLGGPKLKTD